MKGITKTNSPTYSNRIIHVFRNQNIRLDTISMCLCVSVCVFVLICISLAYLCCRYCSGPVYCINDSARQSGDSIIEKSIFEHVMQVRERHLAYIFASNRSRFEIVFTVYVIVQKEQGVFLALYFFSLK